MRPDDGVFVDQVVRPEMRQRQPPVDVLPLLWRLVPPMFWLQDWRPFPPETLHLQLIMIINLASCPFRSSRNPDPELIAESGSLIPPGILIYLPIYDKLVLFEAGSTSRCMLLLVTSTDPDP